jgi:hypothetical protein
VSGNHISHNHFGIFTAGDVTVTGGNNHFHHVDVHQGGVAAY